MTPWELAATSEHSQQRALFAWANCAAEYGFYYAQYSDCYSKEKRERWFTARPETLRPLEPVPELALLFAIHNQGHGDRIRGAQAKAEGVKAGVPDTLLPVRRTHPLPAPYSHCTETYNGLFVELKKLTKGVVSGDQIKWQGALIEQGYAVSVCKGWIEAANTIAGYLGSMVRLDENPV
jgi:hypothetical protein